MNGFALIQSILTYICTAGVVSAIGYFAHLSKRITVLEQKTETQQGEITNLRQTDTETARILSKLNDSMVQLSTKMDLLLAGRLEVKNV